MANNTRPIQFRDYLPAVFREDEVHGVSLLSAFLGAFESLYEELEASIEGTLDHSSGGIPDLFSPDTTPPPQFVYRPQPDLLHPQQDMPEPDMDFLRYLASWIGLPLRAEKSIDFNRAFFEAAITPDENAPIVWYENGTLTIRQEQVTLYQKRSTLPGMEALLRAWLKGDLLETTPPVPLLTDLTRTQTDTDAIVQLGVNATLGVNTVLGEGPPFFFIADLVTDPTVPELRTPSGLEVFQQAARALLDAEKPAYTYYQLRIRAHTMQLAPPPGTELQGEIYAQVGNTTLLWDAPWVFDSDC